MSAGSCVMGKLPAAFFHCDELAEVTGCFGAGFGGWRDLRCFSISSRGIPSEYHFGIGLSIK